MGIDTLVHSFNQFCAQNISAHELVPLVWHREDSDCTTGAEKVKFLTYRLPKLRYILEIIS